jgi:hypothetical protein
VGFFLSWFGFTYDPPQAFAVAHPDGPSPYKVFPTYKSGLTIVLGNLGIGAISPTITWY